MDVWGWLAVSALLMLGVILMILLMQYWLFSKVSQVLEDWHAAAQVRQRRASQQGELQSALRAEQAHVQQLLRKVEILQAMLPAVQGRCL